MVSTLCLGQVGNVTPEVSRTTQLGVALVDQIKDLMIASCLPFEVMVPTHQDQTNIEHKFVFMDQSRRHNLEE